LGRTRFGQALGGALDIGTRDRPAWPGGVHEVEVDIELARQRPDRVKDLKGPRRRRGRRLGVARRLLLLPELAHHRPGVPLLTLGNSTSGAPTLMRSPLPPNKRAMRPLHGDGTSTTALSVSTDTSG